MSFDSGAAVVAGLIGGTAMSALLYMGMAMMPRQMKNEPVPDAGNDDARE